MTSPGQSFNDLNSALQMRDVIQTIAEAVIDSERPDYNYAQVLTVDYIGKRCVVQNQGDKGSYKARFGAIFPQVGQIVRVEGNANDKYIQDALGPFNSSGVVATAPTGTPPVCNVTLPGGQVVTMGILRSALPLQVGDIVTFEPVASQFVIVGVVASDLGGWTAATSNPCYGYATGGNEGLGIGYAGIVIRWRWRQREKTVSVQLLQVNDGSGGYNFSAFAQIGFFHPPGMPVPSSVIGTPVAIGAMRGTAAGTIEAGGTIDYRVAAGNGYWQPWFNSRDTSGGISALAFNNPHTSDVPSSYWTNTGSYIRASIEYEAA